MSACEYAAPTTRLDSRVVFLGPFAGVALRQNCAVELLVNQHFRYALAAVMGGYPYSDLSVFSQRDNRSAGQTISGRTDKTYQLEPSPATSRQSSSAPAVLEKRGLTCGGGFLPLPEEPNIVNGALQRLKRRVLTHGVVVDKNGQAIHTCSGSRPSSSQGVKLHKRIRLPLNGCRKNTPPPLLRPIPARLLQRCSSCRFATDVTRFPCSGYIRFLSIRLPDSSFLPCLPFARLDHQLSIHCQPRHLHLLLPQPQVPDFTLHLHFNCSDQASLPTTANLCLVTFCKAFNTTSPFLFFFPLFPFGESFVSACSCILIDNFTTFPF